MKDDGGGPSPQGRGTAVRDAALLARIARGDKEAFEDFYGHYGARVLRTARRALGDGGLAEELAQEIFVVVWRKARHYRAERGDVAGWLAAVVRNRLNDHWRGIARLERNLGRETEVTDLAGAGRSPELRLALEQALARLPGEQREAVKMVYFEDRTLAEAAARAGVPEGTLKWRVYQGLATLKHSFRNPSER